MSKFIGDEDQDISEIHTECKFDNFKSKVRDLIKRLFPRKGVSKFPDKIDYDAVFKNHATLMRGYGTVLKKDAKTFDMFIFRTVFVQSHIYKKLKSLRTIYIVEIATLYDMDNNAVRSTLNGLVEDIDKLSDCLFYFPAITIKTIIVSIPILASAAAVAYPIWDFFLELWNQGIHNAAYLKFLSALGLTFLMYLGVAALSFIDKRLLFIFPEDNPQGHFDKWKKWCKAFLGKSTGGTIYKKENKLFASLRMGKKIESPVDLFIFMAIALVVLYILVTLSILTPNQFEHSCYLLTVSIIFLLVARRKTV